MIYAHDIEHVENEVKKRLSERRFEHTKCVAEVAEKLALAYSFEQKDVNRMIVAALCHDITRELTSDEHEAILKKNHITVKDGFLRNTALMHAKTGAIVAREIFGDIIDDEIYQAILSHTTARENMTVFMKILYLADYIDNTRTYADCVAIRNFFWEGYVKLDKASKKQREELLNTTIIQCLKNTFKNLLDGSYCIDMETVKAYNYLIDEQRRNGNI